MLTPHNKRYGWTKPYYMDGSRHISKASVPKLKKTDEVVRSNRKRVRGDRCSPSHIYHWANFPYNPLSCTKPPSLRPHFHNKLDPGCHHDRSPPNYKLVLCHCTIRLVFGTPCLKQNTISFNCFKKVNTLQQKLCTVLD